MRINADTFTYFTSLRAVRKPIKSVSLLFSKRQQFSRIFFVFSTIAFVLTHSDLFYYERQRHSDSLKRLELTTLPAKHSAVTATLPLLVDVSFDRRLFTFSDCV